MNKKQVIDFVRRELECGDCVLSSTAGNGGAGGILISDPSFPAYLESLEFRGQVEPIDDIIASPFFDTSMHTYQFDGANGFFVQIQAK